MPERRDCHSEWSGLQDGRAAARDHGCVSLPRELPGGKHGSRLNRSIAKWITASDKPETPLCFRHKAPLKGRETNSRKSLEARRCTGKHLGSNSDLQDVRRPSARFPAPPVPGTLSTGAAVPQNGAQMPEGILPGCRSPAGRSAPPGTKQALRRTVPTPQRERSDYPLLGSPPAGGGRCDRARDTPSRVTGGAQPSHDGHAAAF